MPIYKVPELFNDQLKIFEFWFSTEQKY